ncbi:MAG TPA: outer membrane beta-barrel protein [Xanthobacteraceae bacterium]|nr:outer membrane beta-barrel protein [Xanthobacteraceae bacterium]
MRSVGPGFALVLATMAVAAPAYAADLPVAPAAAPVIPPPAIYNWTGFYVGGNVGAGLLSDNITQSATTATTTNMLTGQTAHPAGLIGGGQAGFNYQFGAGVIGAEAAWSASAITGYGIGPAASLAIPLVTQERNTSNPQWLAAVTGRVGYAANDLLFYAKGGGAWMHVEYTQDLIAGGITAATQVLNDNRTGFTAGAGIEYGMTQNLSARLEYDFYDFGSKTYQFMATPITVASKLHTLTFGLNYRFNWDSYGQPFCPTC